MTIMAPLGLQLGGHYATLKKEKGGGGDEDVSGVPSGERCMTEVEKDITLSHPVMPDVMTDKQQLRSGESAS